MYHINSIRVNLHAGYTKLLIFGRRIPRVPRANAILYKKKIPTVFVSDKVMYSTLDMSFRKIVKLWRKVECTN
jgi:hypothetical protein